MATITNRRPVADMDTERIAVALDVYDTGPMLYDDTYGDHNESIIASRFHDDAGKSAVPDSDLIELKSAAQQTMRRRKPIIDWKTTNASFIEVHNDLRRLGIKNNTFFLKLYDRDLQGVDPFAPGLPLEMQIKIYLECVINPWYYIREIARCPAQGKPIEPGGGDRYILDRNNLATWYCFIHNIDHYASKPRQCGKTQDALHKMNYAYHFGAASSSMLFFNKDLALAKENLARMKDQRDLYPPYLQMRVAFDEEKQAIIKGTDNITNMKNPVTGNAVKVMPCANSEEAANRLGRGYTAPLMFYDECDFSPYIITAIMASVFAYSTASKNAIENHSCAARIFTSTPGDLSTRDGKAMADYIRGTKERKGMMIWDDHMLDDDIREIKRKLKSTSYNGIMYIEHDWKQLKRSMSWYENQCNLCGYDQEVILREILLQRLAGSNLSPFTREQQLYLSSHKKKPIERIPVKTIDTISHIDIYEKMDKRIPYILGIDPSEGLSADNNAMLVINPFTYKITAEYKSPYISPKEFAKFIENFMIARCPRALIVVEANRGREVLQRLTDGIFRDRIWYDADRMNQLLSQKTDEYGGIPNSVISRKVQGFITGTKSRNYLFGCLEQMVMENIDCIYSEHLVNEILTLIRKPTGKIEAAPGEHDDCVMAYLIGLYVYLNASNLEEFGISRRMRRPDAPIEIVRESERDYRDRVRSVVPNLPDQYRGIFEDFLKEKDPVRDSREYARQVAMAQQEHEAQQLQMSQSIYGMTGGMFDLSDQRSFEDHSADDPQYGTMYRPIGYQHRTFNKPDGFGVEALNGPQAMDEAEQDEFNMGIMGLNFMDENSSPFDPDDYV